MMIHSPRNHFPLGACALVACLALAGCERDPTPKMASADAPYSSLPGTAPAEAGTAMGAGTGLGTGSAGVLADASPPAMQADNGGSFEAMTRTEPTGAGMPSDRQAAPVDTPTTAATLSATERDFIARTGAKSLFEIRVSELAAEKATDPALKSYAAMVAADHKGVSEEIKRLAAGHGVNLPEGLAPQDQKTLAALRNADGAVFDKQYLQTVGVTEHEKTIAAYEKAGTDARNPAVKDYVQSTLPTLKAHLDAARKLQTKG